MEDEWYVQTGTEITGPITTSQLRTKFSRGSISTTTLVKQGEDGTWIPAITAVRSSVRQKANAVPRKAKAVPRNVFHKLLNIEYSWRGLIRDLLSFPFIFMSFFFCVMAILEFSLGLGCLAFIFGFAGIAVHFGLTPRDQRANLRRKLPIAFGGFAMLVCGFSVLVPFGDRFNQWFIQPSAPPKPSQHDMRQAEARNRIAQTASLHQHVTFDRIQNTFSETPRAPYFLVDMSNEAWYLGGSNAIRETDRIADARTMVFFKWTEKKVGVYKDWLGIGFEDANEYTVSVCLIDPSNPSRRRVIHARSTPAERIEQSGRNLRRYIGGNIEVDGVKVSDTPGQPPLLLELVLQKAGLLNDDNQNEAEVAP